MNVEIGTEAAQFLEKEYINGIFVAVCIPHYSPILEYLEGIGCKVIYDAFSLI